jgi:hypothetical protein
MFARQLCLGSPGGEISGEALLATPARPLYEPSHRPPKKERPLSFCSDNTVTGDQQAVPVHSGPPFFGFRAYSRCDRLPHAVRSQGSENCGRYPKWVKVRNTNPEKMSSALARTTDMR